VWIGRLYGLSIAASIGGVAATGINHHTHSVHRTTGGALNGLLGMLFNVLIRSQLDTCVFSALTPLTAARPSRSSRPSTDFRLSLQQ